MKTTQTCQTPQQITVTHLSPLFIGRFNAMASPCEILLCTDDSEKAGRIIDAAAHETWRIECKYSRYRPGSVLSTINTRNGLAVTLDEESARLIDFAFECYRISEGKFDISSGILRRAWQFDGKHALPTQQQIDSLLPYIGLNKVRWDGKSLQLPEGMELDLGGIGKEYAVDRVLQQINQSGVAALVNFGGDIAATQRTDGKPWQIGIEAAQTPEHAQETITFMQGGIATSGDARRAIVHNGQRYGHILNPVTGWPVLHSPHAITVIAGTCTQAGILATLAMLKGKGAERFLQHEANPFWIQR